MQNQQSRTFYQILDGHCKGMYFSRKITPDCAPWNGTTLRSIEYDCGIGNNLKHHLIQGCPTSKWLGVTCPHVLYQWRLRVSRTTLLYSPPAHCALITPTMTATHVKAPPDPTHPWVHCAGTPLLH